MTNQPKPLTDADLVVGNRFECLQDIFRGQYGMSFSKGCKYTCEARGTLMSNEGLNHVLSAAVLNHHFKLIQTVHEEQERQEIEDVLIDSQVVILESQVDAEREKNKHLQKQLDEAKEKIEKLQWMVDNSVLNPNFSINNPNI